MKKEDNHANMKRTRSDHPSGRQAARQPEHTSDASNLHQGQGPDFQTQDPRARKHNKGVQQMEKVEQRANKPVEDDDLRKGERREEHLE